MAQMHIDLVQQLMTNVNFADCEVSVKSVLKLIVKVLKQKTETISNQTGETVRLKNENTKLKEKLSEQERYSSKDCVIIENAPFNSNSFSIFLRSVSKIK